MTITLGAGEVSPVPAQCGPYRSAFDLARRLGFDVVAGHPEVGGARVIGDLIIEIDATAPLRVQHSRVARELARVELVRANTTSPTEEALAELASRLLLPEAPLRRLLGVGAELPDLYAAYPLATYELIVCRVAELADVVATCWSKGHPTTRFLPPGRRGGPFGRPVRAERTLAARAMAAPASLSGPGRSRAWSVSEVAGPDVVTLLDAACALRSA